MTRRESPLNLPRFLARFRQALELGPLTDSALWLLLCALSLTIVWSGWKIADRYGLLIGFFTALALFAWVLFFAEWRLEHHFPGEVLEGQDAWGVRSFTRELARRMETPMPALFLTPIVTPFAFGAGLGTKSSRIYLSRGLLDRLSSTEVQCVIAFELLRLKDGRTRRATLAVALAGLISSFCGAVDHSVLRVLGGRTRVEGPLTVLTSPLLALLIRFGTPRNAVFATDSQLVTLLKTLTPPLDAHLWAQTLLKLDAYNKTLPLDVGLAEASLFTTSPLARLSWCRFAVAQPPVEARVARLIGRFPL